MVLFTRLKPMYPLSLGVKRCISTTAVRRGHGTIIYRTPFPKPPKFNIIAANCVGGFMWWWIFWNLWTEYGEIVGEFEYPDPSKWSDAELGIPPDDVD